MELFPVILPFQWSWVTPNYLKPPNFHPGWYCTKTAEQIELVLAFPSLFYTLLEGNSGISKNKVTSLQNFNPNSELRKFCNCTSIVSGAVNLGGQ